MTAKHKRKRLLIENSLDARPKHINLEGSERQEAKREIAQQINEINNKESIESELAWEKEMQMASECHEKEKLDPNYKCTCFIVDEEDV